MKTKKCEQKKCAYLQMGIGCRKCEGCGIEPFIVSDTCERCWNCEHDQGILRWSEEKPKKVSISGKIMLVGRDKNGKYKVLKEQEIPEQEIMA